MRRMMCMKEMIESLKGQVNHYAFTNPILGREPGPFCMLGHSIVEPVW